MVKSASTIWVSLLLLLFAYGATCSALHYGQGGRRGHTNHAGLVAPAAANPHEAHHQPPASAPEPGQTDLECCALIALSAKNLAQLAAAPEDLVPWVPVLFALLLAEVLFPPFSPVRLQPLPFALPWSLLRQKTCLLC